MDVTIVYVRMDSPQNTKKFSEVKIPHRINFRYSQFCFACFFFIRSLSLYLMVNKVTLHLFFSTQFFLFQYKYILKTLIYATNEPVVHTLKQDYHTPLSYCGREAHKNIFAENQIQCHKQTKKIFSFI